jgi:hypothetical protein
MSLLSIIAGACGQLNLVTPSSVVGATDQQTLQLLALARQGGKELARRFDWQVLTNEATFTTAAAEQQTTLSSVVSNFARVIDGTMWNRTQSRRVHGPLTAQEWQRRKAAAAQVGVELCFRIRGDALLFNPAPPAGDTIAFEYVSNQWCRSAAGTPQRDWAADSDAALIDEEILRLDLVWRFLKAKGLDYAEEFRTYEMALADLFGADAGKPVIDMTPTGYGFGVTVPEGNWNLD